MSGPRLLSDGQLQELAILRERGRSYQFLADVARERWGVTLNKKSIGWQMLRLGADVPPKARMTANENAPMVMERGGHIVRRFSKEEDAQIVKLSADGATPSAIARKLGRRINSVRGRMYALARHEARREEEE